MYCLAHTHHIPAQHIADFETGREDGSGGLVQDEDLRKRREGRGKGGREERQARGREEECSNNTQVNRDMIGYFQPQVAPPCVQCTYAPSPPVQLTTHCRCFVTESKISTRNPTQRKETMNNPLGDGCKPMERPYTVSDARTHNTRLG